MINKILLQSIINKYYLGINETVKWKISNGQLEIRFMTPSCNLTFTISSNF
jgi:hypothetical protein